MKYAALGLVLILAPVHAQDRKAAPPPSALGQLAAQLKPGKWVELKTEGLNKKVFSDGGHHALQYSDEASWDPQTRQLFFSGSGHFESPRFVKYTESTNRWTVLPDTPWMATHVYDHQAIDPRSGTYYRATYMQTAIHQFDPKTETWSKLTDIPEAYGPTRQITRGFEFFPEMEGLVVFLTGNGVYFYHLPTKQWRTLAAPLGQGGYHEVARYNPVHKIVVLGGGNDSQAHASKELWKVDATGKVSALASAPLTYGISQSIFTVDPVSGKHLLLSRDKSFHEYDVVRNAWSPSPGDKPPFIDWGDAQSAIWGCVATPIRAHGVVMLVRYAGDNSKVYLYRHAQR